MERNYKKWMRAEINEMETKRIEQINETKSWFFEKRKDQETFSQTNQKEKGKDPN
jgi:hypothetical protein